MMIFIACKETEKVTLNKRQYLSDTQTVNYLNTKSILKQVNHIFSYLNISDKCKFIQIKKRGALGW